MVALRELQQQNKSLKTSFFFLAKHTQSDRAAIVKLSN